GHVVVVALCSREVCWPRPAMRLSSSDVPHPLKLLAHLDCVPFLESPRNEQICHDLRSLLDHPPVADFASGDGCFGLLQVLDEVIERLQVGELLETAGSPCCTQRTTQLTGHDLLCVGLPTRRNFGS